MNIAPMPGYSRRVLSVICLTMSLGGSTETRAAPRQVVIPAGSVIPVRLDKSMSSKTAHPGDPFTATVRYFQ